MTIKNYRSKAQPSLARHKMKDSEKTAKILIPQAFVNSRAVAPSNANRHHLLFAHSLQGAHGGFSFSSDVYR
jgi:hypothetical protein